MTLLVHSPNDSHLLKVVDKSAISDPTKLSLEDMMVSNITIVARKKIQIRKKKKDAAAIETFCNQIGGKNSQNPRTISRIGNSVPSQVIYSTNFDPFKLR